ncbi:MAG: DUF2306 domain-containing protein [Alphaproteobacteria bacterium]|nr:DUF2306 domain-containing protein [Alphaproteobacteria bacterium]
MRLAGKILLYFLAFGVVGYSAVVYSLLPMGAAVHPDMKADFVAHSAFIYTHIMAAIVALALGPFQFSTRLRRRNLRLHRWLGRLYLGIGVLVGGMAGLYISQFAFGGLAALLGFASLAMCWLFTGLRACRAARNGAIEQHRKWMVRNFALTFAAVTLRIYVPASLAGGVDFAVAYPIIAWLCWVPNLLVVEWYLNTANAARPRLA